MNSPIDNQTPQMCALGLNDFIEPQPTQTNFVKLDNQLKKYVLYVIQE